MSEDIISIKNIRYKIILALFIISLISSIILAAINSNTGLWCSPGEGCFTVKNSPYGYTLGIQNSYYGIVIFTFLSILTLSYFINPSQNKKALINLSIIIGSIVILYFLYLQQFVLQAYCKYCLIIDFSMIIAFLLILPELKKGFSSIKIKNEENIAARS